MSENETTPKSLKSTEPRMKDGEEPTEVLLGLVSAPLLALRKRGEAKVLTAKGEHGQPVVLAIFDSAEWSESVGIMLAISLPTVETEKS